jgi:hypothetical protein
MAGRPRLAPSLKKATPTDYHFTRPLDERQQFVARSIRQRVLLAAS